MAMNKKLEFILGGMLVAITIAPVCVLIWWTLIHKFGWSITGWLLIFVIIESAIKYLINHVPIKEEESSTEKS